MVAEVAQLSVGQRSYNLKKRYWLERLWCWAVSPVHFCQRAKLPHQSDCLTFSKLKNRRMSSVSSGVCARAGDAVMRAARRRTYADRQTDRQTIFWRRLQVYPSLAAVLLLPVHPCRPRASCSSRDQRGFPFPFPVYSWGLGGGGRLYVTRLTSAVHAVYDNFVNTGQR